MQSTASVIRFVVIMTFGVAFILASLSTMWSEQSKINEAIFNKRAILSAVSDFLDGQDPKKIPDDAVINIFNEQVTQIALDMSGNELTEEDIINAGYKGGKPENIDMAKEKKKPEASRIMPLYVFGSDQGKCYILSVRGTGLWDEIWGNIALKDDLNTIVGAAFDHKGETPGLGAEIKDNPTFPAKFKQKQIYDAAGAYTSVDVVKPGIATNLHSIDGISGATVTCVGVAEMLERGIKYYEPYLKTIKK